MVKRKLRVGVVIPAYNEGSVLGNVIKSAHQVFSSSPYTIDIIVIDDGSRDSTADEARQSGALVIRHILNSGAGSATATGLSYVNQDNYDIAATMDADGQHNPQDVLRGIEAMAEGGVDLLIGSRLIATDDSDMSNLKRIGNWGLSTITLMLFGVYVTDSQSGLRIFSRRALEQLRWKTSGYEFCSEMIWRANQLSMTIKEYPVKAIYTDYSKVKGQNNWNGINILKSLLRRRLTELFE